MASVGTLELGERKLNAECPYLNATLHQKYHVFGKLRPLMHHQRIVGGVSF
jgi:hypothetical protein